MKIRHQNISQSTKSSEPNRVLKRKEIQITTDYLEKRPISLVLRQTQMLRNAISPHQSGYPQENQDNKGPVNVCGKRNPYSLRWECKPVQSLENWA